MRARIDVKVEHIALAAPGRARQARGPAQQVKSHDGKKVKPVLYVGTAVGHGRYIAGQDESGKMILDRGGKPIHYRLI